MGSIPHLSILKGPTRTARANCIHRIFEENLANCSDKVALIFEDSKSIRKTTYDDLNRNANRIARTIVDATAKNSLPRNADGDYIVAVSMPPSDKLVTVLLGIWKAGASYLPIDPTFPDGRVEHILKEARPVLVVYDQDKESFAGVTKYSVAELEEASSGADGGNLGENECLRSARDDLAIVMYTSGSSGVPKGVRLPHKVIFNRLQWQFRAFPYSKSEEVGIFKTTLTFVDSISEIWGPLISGLAILVVPKATTQDPEKLIAVLEAYKIERLVLVPTLLRSILLYLKMQPNRDRLRSLRIWVCSGEKLTSSLAQEFFEYFEEGAHVLCNFYGSTEIMGDVTYHVVSSGKQIRNKCDVPIGIPIDNTVLYLLDKEYRAVNAGEIGELFVSGLNLAAGYVNNREPEKFIDNPLAIDPTYSKLFRTGDYGRIEAGVLVYEGRTDSQVKVRGHRVDLSEIERAVKSVDSVDKCIVLCYKPGEVNQAVLAFVTTSESISEGQIEEALRVKLTSYMVPQVVLIESVPLLVNGKVDRQTLLRNYENFNNNENDLIQVELDYSRVPESQMKAAKALFETVAEVLGRAARSTISVDSNFYEIGGNSLNSIVTISTLSEKGYSISIADFIAAMDLGEILERMLGASKSTQLISEPPIYRTEMMSDKHKDVVLNMITTSFYEKADLEQWLMPDIHIADYKELTEKLWQPLIDAELCFVVVSEETNRAVGVSLNMDMFDEPEVEIESKLAIIFEFLESIEGPVRMNKLPQGKGKVFHTVMMGTHSSLSAKQNVAVMKYMEDEVLKLASRRNFVGIATTNTSPLTQQLGTSVYGYKTMNDFQVNTYVAPDGSKPFGKAPDSQRAIVQYKEI